MLVYLAGGKAPEWLGAETPAQQARVQQWLSFSHRLTASLGGARLVEMLLRPGDLPSLQKAGIKALRELEAALFEQSCAAKAFWPGKGRRLPISPVFPMWRWHRMAAFRSIPIHRSGSGCAPSVRFPALSKCQASTVCMN